MNKLNTKILDLFGVVKNSNIDLIIKNNTSDYVMEIMKTVDMDKLKINWTEQLHMFYNDQFIFTPSIIEEFNKKILFILTGKEFIDNPLPTLNHLNRFLHLNNLFEKINELNASHDKVHEYKNYTLYRCQDYYLSQIVKLKETLLLNHWFNGIFNGIHIEYDNYNKTRYFKGIEVLKNYLTHKTPYYDNNEIRDKNIDEFINLYSIWCATNLSNMFRNDFYEPIEMFEQLERINKINKFFMTIPDCYIFNVKTIINMLPCWERYLNIVYNNDIKINEKILDAYNDIDLTETEYCNMTLQFCEKWQNKIKSKITHTNYGNSKLFNMLQKVCPLIIKFSSGKNKSIPIIKYFSDIYKFENNLIGYLMVGLNMLIKNNQNLTMTPEIKNSIVLISLYENKEILWNQYFKNTYARIMNLMKKNIIDINVVNFEFSIFELLIEFSGNTFSDKTKSLLTNIENSIKHGEMIKKCKIKYVDKDGTPKNCKNGLIDMNKIDYIVIDKHLWEIFNVDVKYQLIDSDKYPLEIKNSLAIGHTYYKTISDTKTYDWDIENSNINYDINNVNIISSILQYTLIWHIMNYQYTKHELIDHIVNTKLINEQKQDAMKYLELHINNLLFKDIIKITNGHLMINNIMPNQNIDISSFVPSLKNVSTIIEEQKVIDIPVKTNNIIMTKDCLSYLRLMLMTKMFKTHSTTVYQFDNIIESLNKHIKQYINDKHFNQELEFIIKNLVTVDNEQLLRELTYLEKRDIIEKTTKYNVIGYIYVV